MVDPTNVLITGCNRGIGQRLLAAILSRANHIVIAAVRDPRSTASQALYDLPHGPGSKIIVLQIDSTSTTDAFAAVDTLKSKHQITRLDLVITNAGISKYIGKADVTPAEEMLDHFKINSMAPLLLFQATSAPLSLSAKPKFVAMSSGAGSIGLMDKLPVPNTAYGSSKAALNFIMRRIHFENPHLIVFPVNPGWLRTELGNHAARSVGLSEAPVAIQDGVKGVLDVIDHATREDTSGKFLSWDKDELVCRNSNDYMKIK
ncbi:SDR family oxidoreductase [Aspergillus foveolatus]|uniref:SDR family oxidoreductase n=1 Tax=Aspergillus foveolatus TaxID=210207 RepID=UPI003CCCE03D